MTSEGFIKVLKWLRGEFPKWRAPIVTLVAVQTKDPFRILVCTLLSLRTKDKTTAEAAKRLFEVADTPEGIASLPAQKLEKLIFPVGFFRVKAQRLIEISKLILDHYHGKVPDQLDELLSIKGIGRKTANLVLSLGFQRPAICVDVHVHRISNRLGVVTTKTPEETEFALMKKIPKPHWREINDLLVAFGQTICQPIRPKCTICGVRNHCHYYKVQNVNISH